MSSQKVVWTALPNGFVSGSGRLKLSVFVAPRLHPTSGTVLAPFLDWLDWPRTVRHVTFKVQFSDGTLVPATPDLRPLDSDLWKALFKPSTLVRPHALDPHASKFVMSYPIKNVVDYVKGKYQQLGALPPGTPPGHDFLASYLKDLLDPTVMGMDETSMERLGRGLVSAYQGQGGIPAFGDINPYRDLLLLRLYHYVRPDSKPPPPAGPNFDFHQALTALGQHPAIMRKLGLVIDLTIPHLHSMETSAALRIVPQWVGHITAGAALTTNVTPFTAHVLNSSTFAARPSDRHGKTLADGFLYLGSQGLYSLADVDPDGAGLKISYFAMELQRKQRFASSLPVVQTLPALRSAGISLVQSGAAQATWQDFQDATSMNSSMEGGAPVTLYAEDLVRGYAVDVWDGDTGKWHSLCRRKMAYTFPNAPAARRSFAIADEGAVTLAVTQKTDGSTDALHRRESLFRWEGWSLVAPLPSAAINPEDKPTTDASGAPTRPLNTPLPDFPMQADPYVLPGSLPRLRFGTKYRVRVRVVDLAGNGVPYSSPSAVQALPPPPLPAFPYHRYEPVPAPVVILRDALGTTDKPFVGEAVAHLVVRSDIGVSTHDYLAYLTAHGFINYLEVSQRHVVPPKGSAQMAEHHRAWDGSGGMNVKALTTMKHFDGEFPTVAIGKGNDGGNTTYIFSGDQAIVPYLPDVPARGATLSMTSGPAGLPARTMLPFTGSWPALLGFRIRLVGVPDGTPASQSWDETSRVLTVTLPQGDSVQLDLSSYLNPDDLDALGVWDWIASASPADLAALRAAALAGLHRMLTPALQLTLVHAVQRPLITPQFVDLVALPRQIGDTVATLTEEGTGTPVSGKSTRVLEIHGDWQEPVDDPAEPAPTSVTHLQSVARLDVDAADTAMTHSVQHTFTDTRYRRVKYTPIAISRFRSYFPFSDAQIASETPISVSGDPVPIDILSSARPDAPLVLYVVPTFHWAAGTDVEGGVTRYDVNRWGMRLRVYLNRPWYSSGDDEKLGVMLLPAPTTTTVKDRIARVLRAARIRLGSRVKPSTADVETLSRYFTQWGSDPLWGSAPNSPFVGAPSLANFPFASATQHNVSIDELDGVQLDVAGHDVQFDPVRKLWFSDLVVDAPTGSALENAYYPFVRLALARFQPHSVATTVSDVYVSRIRLADFAQLAPNRLASVTPRTDATGNPVADVQVMGVGYTSSASQPAPPTLVPGSSMTVDVQQLDPSISDPDLTWQERNQVTLTGSTSDGINMLWSGQVPLPGPTGGNKIRLVITETETFPDVSKQTNAATRIVYAAQYVL